jgi:hypothetical protein
VSVYIYTYSLTSNKYQINKLIFTNFYLYWQTPFDLVYYAACTSDLRTGCVGDYIWSGIIDFRQIWREDWILKNSASICSRNMKIFLNIDRKFKLYPKQCSKSRESTAKSRESRAVPNVGLNVVLRKILGSFVFGNITSTPPPPPPPPPPTRNRLARPCESRQKKVESQQMSSETTKSKCF